MSLPNSASTAVGAVVGTTATTFPLWHELVAWATGANQWVIAIGGLVVLWLTIRKLLLETRLAERRLREMDEGR